VGYDKATLAQVRLQLRVEAVTPFGKPNCLLQRLSVKPNALGVRFRNLGLLNVWIAELDASCGSSCQSREPATEISSSCKRKWEESDFQNSFGPGKTHRK
jgi:hypothetical protein